MTVPESAEELADSLDLAPLSDLVLEDLGLKVNPIDIVRLALQATAAVLAVYKLSTKEWSIEYKDGSEPLTRADLEANKVGLTTRPLFYLIICTGLGRLFGEAIPVVSEENAHASWEERRAYKYFWLVDPVDGTKEFIKRNGQFTVNIGLCRGEQPVFGVVTVPVQGTVFVGGESFGSYKLEPKKPRQLLRTKHFLLSDQGLRVVASSSHNTPATLEFVSRLTDPLVVQYGSSLKILMLAANEAELYPRFSLCSEWDTCAAHAVLKFAGGEIYPVRTSPGGAEVSTEPLRYRKQSLLNPSFVAIGRQDAFVSSWTRFSPALAECESPEGQQLESAPGSTESCERLTSSAAGS
ncbi:3 (2) -bisphosphate nucleotidase [Cystoisospora suis]|uniref:3'(2'),5'-bisphosphate nucleotidase 1 n=1 Tax=Cystoisospora suis TaxID=483139 RepID=A0A2C6L091_9APIC|nr:3 (2) -bisphosphate nucleotidase [Cystoisospora suis]